MTEAPEEDIHAFDTQPVEEEQQKGKFESNLNALEKKKSVKTSVLTKGFVKHSRLVKSNQGLTEHSRHIRTNSLGSSLMTQSNQYTMHRGYAKLSDSTFKSGDFNKIRTEMEDLIFTDPNSLVEKCHHRRKTSLIKKVIIKMFTYLDRSHSCFNPQ